MLQEEELSPVAPTFPALGPGQGLEASAGCGWKGGHPRVKAGPGMGETLPQLCGQLHGGAGGMMSRGEVMVSNALGKRRRGHGT